MGLLPAILILFWSFTGFAESFDRFEELVHLIKVKSAKNSADQSSGTGFVVDANGILATNYHVVSGIFKNGKVDRQTQVFARVHGQEYLAEILRVDILNDLALIKVPYVFKDKVRIRSSPLFKGEKIYSLGFHDKEFMAINQGTFNDYLTGSENELMAVTCPLNHGMSGGPMLDGNFEVIGVNVLKTGKESDGYGINAKRLARFLSAEEIKAGTTLDELVNQQMRRTYERVSAYLEEAKEFRPLNRWSILSLDHFMECGEVKSEENPNKDTDDADQNQIQTTTRICALDPRKLPLSVLGSDMSLAYATANIQGSKNTRTPTYNHYINQQFKFQDFRSLIGFQPTYRCGREIVKNDTGIDFKISVCLFKLDTLPSFIKEKYYRYEIQAITLTPTMDNVVLRAQFSGSKDVAKKIVKKMLNGVRLAEHGGSK